MQPSLAPVLSLRPLVFTVTLLALPGASVLAAETPLKKLRKEVAVLQQQSHEQSALIRELQQTLAALTASPAAVPGHLTGQSGSTALATIPGRTALPSSSPAPSPSLPVVSEIPKSVSDIYQEASGFDSSSTFSLEPGFTYSHYDTRELRLNGFLALDSIFLGSINLDRLRSDSMTFDLTGRYSPSPRWQFDVNLPFIARDATYFSGGAGGSSSTVSQSSVNQGPKLGDVSFGVGYKLVQEDMDWPDIVWSLHAKAPTGSNPYGIKLIPSAGNDNLSVPERLPTGNGVWAYSTGLSFVKTVDPAVLFASVGYTHYAAKHFNDISAQQDVVQAGSVKLGDSLSFGAGFAFALNDRLSLGMSYSQQMARKSQTKSDGGAWNDVPGSDANAATLNVGLTYALNKRLSIIPNLAVGLTPDTANYAFSIKFPYRF